MLKRPNLYQNTNNQAQYTPEYKIYTHINGYKISIETSAGCSGFYPDDLIEMQHDRYPGKYSKNGKFRIIGVTDYDNKIVLCGKVVCPDLSLMEHGGVIYLFRRYIADGTAIVLHSRNYKKILSYKQYPSTW